MRRRGLAFIFSWRHAPLPWISWVLFSAILAAAVGVGFDKCALFLSCSHTLITTPQPLCCWTLTSSKYMGPQVWEVSLHTEKVQPVVRRETERGLLFIGMLSYSDSHWPYLFHLFISQEEDIEIIPVVIPASDMIQPWATKHLPKKIRITKNEWPLTEE